jgi:ABC-type nickel/cobalt efflux system permease component RcnA
MTFLVVVLLAIGVAIDVMFLRWLAARVRRWWRS